MSEQVATSRILIVGSGITGTALAALLEQKGIVADVVERMPDWSRDGYGITIMPPGMEVLRKLEVVSAVRKEGSSADGFNFLNPDGSLIRKFQLKSDGVDSVTLNRSDLHKSLLAKLEHTDIRMGTSIIAIHDNNTGIDVTFSDGSSASYDLVIGTDGVRSATRSLIFPDISPKYAGAAIWTFFLPHGVELPKGKNVMEVWNDHEFMGIFPIKDGAAVTFSAPLESSVDLASFDLDKHFEDIHFLAHDILKKLKNKDVYAGYLNEMTLGQWYKGKVILAGDAAHAMMPATGMGASMGLQDALTLSKLITNTPSSEWATVPAEYQKQRKHVVDRVQKEAYIIGRMMFLESPLKDARNTALKIIPQFVVTHQLQHK